MATSSQPSNTALSKKDLGALHNALYPARNSYKFLGLQIGVEIDEIESIEGKCTDHSDRLLAILSVRLKQIEPLTWNDIDTALRFQCVGESRTADSIRKKYPHLFSPDPSIGSDQEHEGQMHVKKEKTKKKRRRKKPKVDHPLHMSDEQEEDSDEEVSGRVRRKKTKKYPKQPESNDNSSAVSSIEITEELEKEREKAEIFSAPERKIRKRKREIHEREKKKGKMKKVEYKERKEQPERPEVYEKEEKKKRNAKVKKKAAHEKGKSLKYEFSDIASDDHEYQSSDVNQNSKKQKLPQQVRVGPGKESSSAQKEMPIYSDTRQKENQFTQRVESKSKDKNVEMHAKRKTKDEMRKEHSATRKATAEGYERQQYSHGREVSEKPKRKKEVDPDSDSENEPSSTSTSEEETSEMAGVESTAPKSKPSVSHTQQPIDCGKEIERKRSKRKQMLLEEQQHLKGKSATHRLTKKTKQFRGGKSVKSEGKETEHTKKKGEKEKLKLKEKEKLPHASESTQEDSQDEESDDGSEDEEDRQESSEEEETEPDDGSEDEEDRQESSEEEEETEPDGGSEDEEDRQESSEEEEETEPDGGSEDEEDRQESSEEEETEPDDGGEDEEDRQESSEEEEETEPDDGSEDEEDRQESSEEEEETEPDDGSEDEEDRQESSEEEEETEPDDGGEDDRVLDLQSSNCEEETAPDDESSTATSEEGVKVKKKPIAKESEYQDITTRKGKEERGKVAYSVYSLKDNELSCGKEQKEQEEHGIQPKKKRTRRNHGESSIARGSSSPSTSQEDNQKQRGAKGQGKQKRKKKKERLPCSSEFDDLSPESDKVKNLPDAEKKRLSGIFTCFFGELCCAVVDPVEIAAQLQKKSLISKATMIEILKSPESQQDKTIALVSKLEKKIDSCPDCLFVLIEVLLQNEALQRTGNEMLRETGKICPDRTAVMLPKQLLTSDTLGDASENSRKGDIHTSREISVTSTQDVSQFLPGKNAVLAEYKQYLQSVYDARALAPADKYLPTLEAPYINLAMIRRGQPYNSKQRDEFTRQTLHGGVDQILENKTPINIEDLLTPEEGGKPVRFILVEGPPGIGKSTFAWEVCRRWDEIESLRQYHTVVLLKLREKWVLNAVSLPDLFRYGYNHELSKSVSDELAKNQGRNLLLVLDGFDEVSHSFHEDSVIKSILCRQLLPKCTVILTTRPSAMHTLREMCQPQVDKHVEIIRFTEEERVRYITEVFSKDPELQMNFLKYMFLVPHIKSMMYIPLNCAIIAQVYYESQSSRHLAIPRTRTQLYKALTHSLITRDMRMKECNHNYTSMLPEGLNEEDMKNFRTLEKFAFDSYHKHGTRKITFFKEDIPRRLVHFGFMNESTEMYAGKGVEQIFSFLHLSLQEYLAAWHLANSYSIEFQVAYHRLAADPYSGLPGSDIYKGDNREEEALMSSLEPLEESLVEPAIFLAGITGWRPQSEGDNNRWEMYLSHDTAEIHDGRTVLLHSLYESQNPTLLPLYFRDTFRSIINIGSSSSPRGQTPYECYALSYCVAHLDKFRLLIEIKDDDDDVSLLETFVKGLEDHCKSSTTNIKYIIFHGDHVLKSFNRWIHWLNKVNILTQLDQLCLDSTILKHAMDHDLLQSLVKFKSLNIGNKTLTSWEWLPALKSLTELKSLGISSYEECGSPPTDDLCWLVEHRLREFSLYIKYPSNIFNGLHSPADVVVDSLRKSVLRSNQITTVGLCHISHETMAGVRGILLHCPSLTTLGLESTRLGYDGILYICSALRNNTTLRHLSIHEDPQSPQYRSRNYNIIHFSSMETVPLPDKITPTDFLLELNNILKDNTTLEEMKIRCGVFFPLSDSAGGYGRYYRWTGLGPLQQFNVGAVASGMSPNLRRSFSLSDLTQPQTQLFWSRPAIQRLRYRVDFKKLFSKRQKEGKKLFSLPSFTAPDTGVLQSFSGLDPRLNECLGISDLHQYVEDHKEYYRSMLEDFARYMQKPDLQCNKSIRHFPPL